MRTSASRTHRYPALLLVARRMVDRQIMSGVAVRAIGSAVAGLVVGWGKLERTGRVAPAALGSPHAMRDS